MNFDVSLFGKNVNIKTLNKGLVNDIIAQTLQHLINEKVLSVKELDDEELVGEVLKIYFETHPLEFVVNHKEDILENAEQYLSKSYFELYFVFLAMFFEHSINEIVRFECLKQEINNNNVKSLLKSIGIRDKFTWLLALLKLPKFNPKHLGIITQIVDRRNAFVHYKFVNLLDNKLLYEKEQKENKKLIALSKPAIKYMKRYHSLIKHNKQKKNVHKKAKSMTK